MGLECNARGELSLEVSLLLQQGAETAQQLPRRVGADGRVLALVAPLGSCSRFILGAILGSICSGRNQDFGV